MRLFLLLFFCSSAVLAQTISRVEYFFDTDPGFGNGIEISITAAADLTQNATIPLGLVNEGFHVLFIRAKSNAGLWSHPVIKSVYVQRTAQSATLNFIDRIEYFFNTDPGTGNGIEIPITSAIDITRDFIIPLTTIAEGFNTLYVRAKDSQGLWSIPVIYPVFVQRNAQSAATPQLKNIEYFLDADPGVGNGTQLSLSSSVADESFVINLSGAAEGFHVLYVRSQDVNGRWSLPLARPFFNANSGTEIVALEYFHTDGTTQTTPKTYNNFTPGANLTIDFAAALEDLLPSTSYEIRITAIDDENKRSKEAIHVFVTPAVICDPITPPSVINATLCESGSVTLIASGATATQDYQWYTSATEPNAITITTGNSFTTPTLTDTTAYFVSIRNGTCESVRIPVTAFIVPTPSAPVASNNSSCGVNSTITLTATGGTNGDYRWYEVATGGTALPGEVNDTFITPPLSTTTTYYVSLDNTSCESMRTAVTATINPIPPQPLITSSIAPVGNALTICGSPNLTLSAPSGYAGYLWSNGSTSPIITVSVSDTYSVTVTDTAGCISLASESLSVTILPEPCINKAPTIAVVALSTIIEGQVTVNLVPLITDADDNLNLASLTIIQPPASGAIATLINGVLQINYAGVNFTGKDQLTIQVCDVFNECTQQILEIDVIGDIEIYNGLSTGSDGKNDIFLIQYIEILPDTQDNRVTIYNRWGNKVFEVEKYNNTTKVFRGLNDNGNELPSGTYFYKIEFNSGRRIEHGYLMLKK